MCTLRAAIQEANALAGTDTVGFNVPGPGPHTIQPPSPLPNITDPVVIDGYTQPGAQANTNPPELGTNAVLQIELDGSLAGGGVVGLAPVGLAIEAGGSTVKGLVINRFFNGRAIELVGASGNVIGGNFIGTDVTGNSSFGDPNSSATIQTYGILVNPASSSNLVGGTDPADRNLVSGNYGGVLLNFDDNRVQGNLIGLNAAGAAAVPNTVGVGVGCGLDNHIGGAATGEGNVISGNGLGGGLSLGCQFATTTRAIVQGNLIGTDVSGSLPVANLFGIDVSSSDNTIGGTTPAARNVISANERLGIGIRGSRNLIQGNFIGTDRTGTVALGNAEGGIFIGGTEEGPNDNTIGGTDHDPGICNRACNLISGNGAGGVAIDNPFSGRRVERTLIQGNFIGTDVNGTAALPNSYGVAVFTAPTTQIGGSASGAGNLISGNLNGGVSVGEFTEFTGPSAPTVQGNRIGSTVNGSGPLPNGGVGILIGGYHWLVDGNTIAFNDSDGVRVLYGTGNSIRGNSIFSNASLGIDLNGNGVDANDIGDGDAGPNNFQNFPVLTSAVSTPGGTVSIGGSLNSAARTAFTLEFFANDTCDPSGHGEGQRFLGRKLFKTDGSGNTKFAATFVAVVNPGEFITATATDPGNNTSEFSECRLATAAKKGKP